MLPLDLMSLFFCSLQQFFIALRLVACAQNGLEVALKSLNVAVPPPKFVSLMLYNKYSVQYVKCCLCGDIAVTKANAT